MDLFFSGLRIVPGNTGIFFGDVYSFDMVNVNLCASEPPITDVGDGAIATACIGLLDRKVGPKPVPPLNSNAWSTEIANIDWLAAASWPEAFSFGFFVGRAGLNFA